MKKLLILAVLAMSTIQLANAKHFIHGSRLEHGISQCCDYATENPDGGITYSGCHRSSPQACNGFVVPNSNPKKPQYAKVKNKLMKIKKQKRQPLKWTKK